MFAEVTLSLRSQPQVPASLSHPVPFVEETLEGLEQHTRCFAHDIKRLETFRQSYQTNRIFAQNRERAALAPVYQAHVASPASPPAQGEAQNTVEEYVSVKAGTNIPIFCF